MMVKTSSHFSTNSPLAGESNRSCDLVGGAGGATEPIHRFAKANPAPPQGGSKKALIVASHNEGKVREIRALLTPLGFTVRSAGELGLSEPEETGDTFEANAELKARASAMAAQLPALADDSGLVVPALDGAPGIYSARWAGPEKDFTTAFERIAAELRARDVEPNGTAAYFVCVLSLAAADGSVVSMRGEVHGTLTFPPRGERGFGYDPIFIAKGYTQTFGEIDPEEKHRISHRAKAFSALLHHLHHVSAA